MTEEELLALPLRELDAMVAEKVMGWRWRKWLPLEKWGYPIPIGCQQQLGKRFLCHPEQESMTEPAIGDEEVATACGWIRPYSTDDNAVRLVRNRIAEMGLRDQYVRQMVALTKSLDVFLFQQATPQQQCVAAILVAQEKERGE